MGATGNLGSRQQMTDVDLVSSFATDGCEEALAEIIERYSAMVYSACLRRLANPHDAEDASQAVFIAFARKAPRMGPRLVLPVWLRRAAVYAARQILRERSRRAERERKAAEVRANEATGIGLGPQCGLCWTTR